MRPAPKLACSLIKAIEDFPCGAAGKGGYVWQIDEDAGVVRIVLNCGHPLGLKIEHSLEYLGMTFDVCEFCKKPTVRDGICFSKACRKFWERQAREELAAKINKPTRRRLGESRSLPSETAKEEGSSIMAKKNGIGNGNGVNGGNGVSGEGDVVAGGGIYAGAIPGKGGSVPISGMEKIVNEMRVKHAYLAVLEAEVEAMKIKFRKQAAKLWEEAAEEVRPKEFRFIGDQGAIVSVSMPDESADSTRKTVSDALMKNMLKLGVDVGELGVLEVVEEVTLSGDWLPMIKGIVQKYYTERGIEVPPGLHERATRKLTADAFDKLRDMKSSALSDKEREAYELLLDGGKKAPTVKVE